MTTLLVKSIHTLVTMDAARREIKNGALFIRDGVIEAVGTEADMPAERADRQIELPKHVVIPGLINTHHHMFQSLTRVIAQEHELFDWLRTLYPIWQQFERRGDLRFGQAGDGGTDALRLHHVERSPLHLSRTTRSSTTKSAPRTKSGCAFTPRAAR